MTGAQAVGPPHRSSNRGARACVLAVAAVLVGVALLASWLAIDAAATARSATPLALLASLAALGLWPSVVLATTLFGPAARAARGAAVRQALALDDAPQRSSQVRCALHDLRHQAAETAALGHAAAQRLQLQAAATGTALAAVECSGRALSQSALAADALAAATLQRHGTALPACGEISDVLVDLQTQLRRWHTGADTVGVAAAAVDDLAFESQVLALNAAVEAARAGEQGRGFAAVATQVGELAERGARLAEQLRRDSNDAAQPAAAATRLCERAITATAMAALQPCAGGMATGGDVGDAAAATQALASALAALRRAHDDGADAWRQVAGINTQITAWQASLAEACCDPARAEHIATPCSAGAGIALDSVTRLPRERRLARHAIGRASASSRQPVPEPASIPDVANTPTDTPR